MKINTQIIESYKNLMGEILKNPKLKRAEDSVILNKSISFKTADKPFPLGDITLKNLDGAVVQYSCEEKINTGQKIISQTTVKSDGKAYRTCVDAKTGEILINNKAVSPEDPDLPVLQSYIKGKTQNPTALAQITEPETNQTQVADKDFLDMMTVMTQMWAQNQMLRRE